MSTNNLEPKKSSGRTSPDWMDDEPDTEPSEGWWTVMPARPFAMLVAIIAAAILAGYALG